MQEEGTQKGEISHCCYESRFGSGGRIHFIENSPSGGEQWQRKAVDRVTDNINCKECKDKSKHLTNINFPTLATKPIVDILIGIGYSELRDVKGDSREPIARLTSLGWTCI